MEDQDVITLSSSIDPDYSVAVIYPEYPQYQLFKELIKDSIAFLVIDKSLIVVDGKCLDDLSFDHFKAIQAHEIAHSILEHSEGNSDEIEIEADLVAIDLLIKRGEIKASKELSKRLKDQRNIGYGKISLRRFVSEKSMNLYKKYLEKKSL